MAYLGRGPGFPLFLDQTEAQRAENFLGETAPHPPSLSKSLDDRAPNYLKVWIRH